MGEGRAVQNTNIQGARPKADAGSELRRPHLITWGSTLQYFIQVAKDQAETVTHIGLLQQTSQEAWEEHTKRPDSTTSEQNPVSSRHSRSKALV